MKIPKKHFSNSLKITKLSGAAMGVLLYNRRQPISESKRIINKVYFVFCCYILTSGILGGIVDMIYNFRVNFLAATHVIPCICYATITMFSIVSVVNKLDKAEHLLNVLEDLWPSEDLDESEGNVVISYINMWNTVKNVFTIFNIFFILFFDLTPVFLMTSQYITTGHVIKSLPFYIYLPFDTTATYIYPFAYLFQVGVSTVGTAGLLATDTFFITVICHIVIQLKLLKTKIENLVEEITPAAVHSGVDVDHNYHQKMYEALTGCIQTHSELIKLTDTIEDIFSLSILVNFLGSSIMICCVGFQSTAASGLDLFVFLMFLVWSLLQNFFICWAGNHLINASTAISDAAYNSSWYLADRKYRQLIRILMMRAQRPQVVTALGFSVVSFQSFSSILSTSYSYFTLLQTTYNGK